MGEAARKIRVVLADDHELVLEGLRAVLQHEPDIEVVGTATDGVQLMQALRTHSPDVVVLDVRMPNLDGLACLRKIRKEMPETYVLILTAFDDQATLRAALELEADGLVLKTDPPSQVVAAIRQVHSGHVVFPKRVMQRVKLGEESRKDPLSPREREVLSLVAQGLTNTMIAERLGMSENTVKFHLQNIFLKLGVTNRTEAAAYYFRHFRGTPLDPQI